MGVILSKFRRAKPSLEDQLEKIDKELHEIRRFQVDTELQQKRIIGRLSIVAFFIYAFGILAYYLFIHTESFTWSQHALSLLPFIVFPIVIWSLRTLFGWWYQRKIVLNKEKSDSLRKDKERLLDEVMDTETFKVAKKILEKYAPSHLLPKYLADQQRSIPVGTPLTRGGLDNNALRRRTMGGPSVTPGMRPQFPPGFRPQFGGRPPLFRPQQQQQAIMGPPGTPTGTRPVPGMSSVPTGFTPMRFMLPPAPSAPVFHNRKTGWLDKLVDYVVADGPAHRYALICRYCATHNGLATPDDFPYTGYRCIYCRQVNPPRQQRPSAATLPRNTVLIEEMDATLRDPIVTASGESGGEEDTSTREERDSEQPLIDLEDSTNDEGSTKSAGEEEEHNHNDDKDNDGNVPFMDDEEEEPSVVERVITTTSSQNSESPEASSSRDDSVVGKLQVNIHYEDGEEVQTSFSRDSEITSSKKNNLQDNPNTN